MGGVFIEVAVILAGTKFAVFLLYEEEGDVWREFNRQIFPVARFSLRKSLVAFFSLEERG